MATLGQHERLSYLILNSMRVVNRRTVYAGRLRVSQEAFRCPDLSFQAIQLTFSEVLMASGIRL